MTDKIPDHVVNTLNTLNGAGYEGYLVGGCVRDCLLGRAPGDWDIATNALPEQVKACFAGQRVIESGIKHGTVTVLPDGHPVEITTYRVDGAYSDHRRPDAVTFSANLRDDLSRRDFRMNAMAFHPNEGSIDPFHGQADIWDHKISCVGDPGTRFREDALRILRAARFASVLGFSIEPETAAAMEQLAPLLRHVSAERVCVELSKACTGPAFADVLSAHRQMFTQIIPELAPMFAFGQHSKYHHLDVFEHTVEAVRNADPDREIRLTMLLHDAGKPHVFTRDKQGSGHFYGHEAESADIADRVLTRLRFDNLTRRTVTELVRVHDMPLKTDNAFLCRKLNRHGPDLLQKLLRVQRADTLAHAPAWHNGRIENLQAVSQMLAQILDERQVFALKNLAVKGNDLLAIGYSPGQGIGIALERLLNLVIDGSVPNDREILLVKARQWKEDGGI